MPNVGASSYVNQILMALMGETDKNMIIVRDLNAQFTSKDRSKRQKLSKEITELTKNQEQMHLFTSIKQLIIQTENTFFSLKSEHWNLLQN